MKKNNFCFSHISGCDLQGLSALFGMGTVACWSVSGLLNDKLFGFKMKQKILHKQRSNLKSLSTCINRLNQDFFIIEQSGGHVQCKEQPWTI